MKLPNLLLHRPNKDDKQSGEHSVVKVCDFGISQIINPSEFNGLKKTLMKERSGTS